GIRDLIVTGVQTCALPIYRAGVTRTTSGHLGGAAASGTVTTSQGVVLMTTVRVTFDGRVFVPEKEVNLPVGSVLEIPIDQSAERSEERRVGRECGWGGGAG